MEFFSQWDVYNSSWLLRSCQQSVLALGSGRIINAHILCDLFTKAYMSSMTCSKSFPPLLHQEFLLPAGVRCVVNRICGLCLAAHQGGILVILILLGQAMASLPMRDVLRVAKYEISYISIQSDGTGVAYKELSMCFASSRLLHQLTILRPVLEIKTRQPLGQGVGRGGSLSSSTSGGGEYECKTVLM